MGRLSLLQIATQFCQETGLPVPAGLVGSQDGHATQLRALLIATANELTEYRWGEQKKRVTWTSTAGTDQGDVLTVFGPDYRELSPGTFWDETLRRPIFGPPGDVSWELYQALVNPGPLYTYNILQNRVLINPAMPAGHTLAATYWSSFYVIDASDNYIAAPNDDSDRFVFPDQVMLLGLAWKWKKVKGEDWEADRTLWMDSIARNIPKNTQPVKFLDQDKIRGIPGIVIPAGSWNVP